MINQNTLNKNSIEIYCSQMYDQLFFIIFFNEISAKETCVELDRSDDFLLFFNEFSNAHMGLYLDNAETFLIACNNFHENEMSARFNKGNYLDWLGNYWDRPCNYPKSIFGTRGYFGRMP